MTDDTQVSKWGMMKAAVAETEVQVLMKDRKKERMGPNDNVVLR